MLHKMKENVCIPRSEILLSVCSLRVPLFLLLISISGLINLKFKLLSIKDAVNFRWQFLDTIGRCNCNLKKKKVPEFGDYLWVLVEDPHLISFCAQSQLLQLKIEHRCIIKPPQYVLKTALKAI